MNTPAPERVIVVVHADGFIEVRATGNVLAVVVNRPEAVTLEDEQQVDEMMQSIVPRQYQDLMLYAGDVIATANVERVTREQLADTITTAGIMDALRSDPRQPRAEHIAWQRLGGMTPRRAFVGGPIGPPSSQQVNSKPAVHKPKGNQTLLAMGFGGNK